MNVHLCARKAMIFEISVFVYIREGTFVYIREAIFVYIREGTFVYIREVIFVYIREGTFVYIRDGTFVYIRDVIFVYIREALFAVRSPLYSSFTFVQFVHLCTQKRRFTSPNAFSTHCRGFEPFKPSEYAKNTRF